MGTNIHQALQICDKLLSMTTVADIVKVASEMNQKEQTELVSSLLERFDPNPHVVSDEEALRRRDELKNGSVQPMPEGDFWQACGRK